MRLASAALLLAIVVPAAAHDAERGRALYETHCGGCHYERVHERLKSDIRDLDGLRATVAKWAPQTRRNFAPDELDDIVEYLNVSHYHFAAPSAYAPEIPGR